MTRPYEFRNLKYKNTCRGVHVRGDIFLNGGLIGTFEQQPFAACIARIPNGHINSETVEKLLEEAEDRMIQEQARAQLARRSQ